MKNVRVLLLSCALLTVSSLMPTFICAIKNEPLVNIAKNDISKKSRSIIEKAREIITHMLGEPEGVRNEGFEGLLKLFPDVKGSGGLGFLWSPSKKEIQELAFLIDQSNLMVDMILTVDVIDPAVIIRLIDYIKVGMPHRLNDFVSKALVAAAFSKTSIMTVLVLLQYNPNLNFKYLGKTAYSALKIRAEENADDSFLQEILLRVMTGGDFWDEYHRLVEIDAHRAYDLARSFILLKFDIEFKVIRVFFEYIYYNQSSSFNEERQLFMQSLLISLSPHNCIRIIQEFLKNSQDDYALAMIEDIVKGVRSGQPTSPNFLEIFTDLLPKIPKYNKGSSFDVSVNNLIQLKKQEEDIEAQNRELELQYREIQESVAENQRDLDAISRSLATPFSNDTVISD